MATAAAEPQPPHVATAAAEDQPPAAASVVIHHRVDADPWVNWRGPRWSTAAAWDGWRDWREASSWRGGGAASWHAGPVWWDAADAAGDRDDGAESAPAGVTWWRLEARQPQAAVAVNNAGQLLNRGGLKRDIHGVPTVAIRRYRGYPGQGMPAADAGPQ